jgi:hypothetical protein
MRSPNRAQAAALAGEAESQDTQEVMMNYHQQFGVGLWSSSPSQPLPPDQVLAEVQRHPRQPKVHQKFVGTNTFAQPSTTSSKQSAKVSKARGNSGAKEKVNVKPRGSTTNEDPASDSSCCKGVKGKGQGADEGSSAAKRPGGVGPNLNASNSRASFPSRHTTPACSPKQVTPSEAVGVSEPLLGSQSRDEYVQQLDNSVILLTSKTASPAQLIAANDDAKGATSSSAKQSRPPRRKMDPSQSPTQSNDGRSYDQYISRGDDLTSTDPVEKPDLASQQSSQPDDGDKTLQEDDTGAVNFRNIDEYNDNSSAPDSLGPGRPSHSSPDRFPTHPETPAAHKNPFAGSTAHLLPASQMFGQTQVSSAYKVASPTSSRPSPDIFQLQNSISPNIFISSPLKNLGTGPHPLEGVISSPQLSVPYDASPQHHSDGAVMPKGAAVDSTPLPPARTFPRGPAERYEPLYTSQQQNESSPQNFLGNESDGDGSEDDAVRRYFQTKLKRAKVDKKLESVKYKRRSPPEDAVVPSTNTRQHYDRKRDPQQYRDQCEGRAGGDSQTTVEDSQDRVVIPSGGNPDRQEAVIDDSQDDVVTRPAEHAADVPSNEALVMATLPNTARSASGSPAETADGSPKLPPKRPPRSPPRSDKAGEGGTDPVPETSPPMLQVRPFHEMLALSAGGSPKQESFTTLLRSSLRGSSPSEGRRAVGAMSPEKRDCPSSEARQPAMPRDRIFSDPSAATTQATRRNSASRRSVDQKLVEVAETSPTVGSRPIIPALNTRAGLRSSRNRSSKTSPPVPGSSGSSLSALTVTPPISSKTTPLTEDSPDLGADKRLSLAADRNASPSAGKTGRTRGTRTTMKAKPTATDQRSLRNSTRKSASSLGREASVSTDELGRSPQSSIPTTFEQSAMLSRNGRKSLRERPVSRESSRGGGANLFAGMTFAVSFQAQQPGEKDSKYNSRIGLSTKVTDQIKQGGGKILSHGFEELFEVGAIKNAAVVSSTPLPDDEIKLTAAAKQTGFTALIADGHSRKVKYMQALALGLPCIHERWITTCTEKQELVAWSDYLLCAGNSSFLGDAIRSRNLPMYDAASAKLSEVIDRRPRLLRGSRILLVLRKQDESKKMAYVFLTRVLDASLSRVYTVDEARKQLKESEDNGHPYDWVYVDEKMIGSAGLFADNTASSSTAALAKKRKRKSTAEVQCPAPKKIRTLSNELVIQSLILGRLIEEDQDVK